MFFIMRLLILFFILFIPIRLLIWCVRWRRGNRGVSANRVSGSEYPYSQELAQSRIEVILRSELKKVPTADEEVNIPPGTSVKVRRSRTIEHTIDVNWGVATQKNIDIGVKQIISASIQSEIERRQGCRYQQSETIEYEIELNGERGARYKLSWSDIWRTGTVEFKKKGKFLRKGETQVLPFELRERAELEVTLVDAVGQK